MKKLFIFILLLSFISCSTQQKGFDYKKHHKSNTAWKHKAEHNKLPKCKNKH